MCVSYPCLLSVRSIKWALEGVLDRPFLPGGAVRLEDRCVRPDLALIGRQAAVTNSGGTRLRAIMAGDPPRVCVFRSVWHACWPERTRYVAPCEMNRARDARRARFLDHSSHQMEDS